MRRSCQYLALQAGLPRSNEAPGVGGPLGYQMFTRDAIAPLGQSRSLISASSVARSTASCRKRRLYSSAISRTARSDALSAG